MVKKIGFGANRLSRWGRLWSDDAAWWSGRPRNTRQHDAHERSQRLLQHVYWDVHAQRKELAGWRSQGDRWVWWQTASIASASRETGEPWSHIPGNSVICLSTIGKILLEINVILFVDSYQRQQLATRQKPNAFDEDTQSYYIQQGRGPVTIVQ